MAQRRGKSPEAKHKRAGAQLPLPASQAPAAPTKTTRVLPMDLKVEDRLVDETGEWEVTSLPSRSNAGKNASVRVQKVGQPIVTELRTWGAHERVSVKRAAAEDRNQWSAA